MTTTIWSIMINIIRGIEDDIKIKNIDLNQLRNSEMLLFAILKNIISYDILLYRLIVMVNHKSILNCN